MTEIRVGELSAEVGLPVKTLRRLADSGRIPSVRTPGGHRVFDLDRVREALRADAIAPSIAPPGPPAWSATVALAGLREDEVWASAARDLGMDQSDEALRITKYAFTEMLNNAIDHSGGTSVVVDLWDGPRELAFRIEDDGDGVFAHLRTGLGLERDLDAAAELTKGKRTTMRERHSGEGIFFTSKAVDAFRLSANGLRLTFDNQREDYALGVGTVRVGTVVEAMIPRPPANTLRAVFDAYTDEDGDFSKSRPTVKLFGAGTSFVSRSEAKRLLENMEEFGEVEIDFTGVEDVGQGFADELVRVWPAQHPDVQIRPTNMNDAVAFMIERALRSR